MLLWLIYVDGSNETYVSLHVQCPVLRGRKECSFAHGVLQTSNLAKQFVMTHRMCIAVKHFTRSEGSNKI